MKFIKNTTTRLEGEYISESEILGDDNKKYFVVITINDLLYATFDGSYIDYLKGKTEKPHMIEGDNYMWFDVLTDRKETIFWPYYYECFDKVTTLSRKAYIKKKYAHLKKPNGNIKYEIVLKDNYALPGCGGINTVYKMVFHILDNDTYLYVCADDMDIYSIFDKPLDDKFNDTPLESFEGFEKAKKSKYYDLYLELEKYIDGVDNH